MNRLERPMFRTWSSSRHASLVLETNPRGLFVEYPSSALRPDYLMPLVDPASLAAGTTINKMELRDNFLNCHSCSQGTSRGVV